MVLDEVLEHNGAPVYDWLILRSLDRTGGDPVLWPPQLLDLIPLDFLPFKLSQSIGVSRRNDKTNRLNCSSACCLYFVGHKTSAMWALSHPLACTSLPLYARRTL
ncbi:hypothetical protein TNCV_647071 [Trichonephila clavipes]|uniref:Uncharacterized protein n=1 Tax=Trichonephila clavipes TaxID=2585209 RepID=A0A8X6VNA1_TRICX|nr:hypothetical protein TNCV_647071 [Trichonephila clavipes]